MSSLSDHASKAPIKMLVIGDSGLGKTGALAALAIAGYNLRIMDFDNGVDILAGVLRPGIPPYNLTPAASAAAMARINYVTLTDQMRAVGGKIQPVTSKAWNEGVNLLTDWKPDNLGPTVNWGPKDILVCDSLTFAGKAALRFICSMNGRLAVPPYQSDYGDAQRLLENFLAMLYSDSIKCHVVVLSHIREVGKTTTIETTNQQGNKGTAVVEEEGSRKGYAETGTGRALSPTVGRYFNTVLMVDLVGTGQAARREIVTVPTGNIGLKNSAPGVVKARYPLMTGLADYFTAIRGEVPVA